jgi:hypothetical protein
MPRLLKTLSAVFLLLTCVNGGAAASPASGHWYATIWTANSPDQIVKIEWPEYTTHVEAHAQMYECFALRKEVQRKEIVRYAMCTNSGWRVGYGRMAMKYRTLPPYDQAPDQTLFAIGRELILVSTHPKVVGEPVRIWRHVE